MKGQKLLKISGILLIITAGLAIFPCIMYFYAILTRQLDPVTFPPYPEISEIFYIVFSLTAGILSFKAAKLPTAKRLSRLCFFSIMSVVLSIIAFIITLLFACLPYAEIPLTISSIGASGLFVFSAFNCKKSLSELLTPAN